MDDTAKQGTFSYDRVAYPSPVFETLNPDRIRASALLHGYNTADAEAASILEIGCGDGISLIAWAAIAPRARVVGFDLSASAIAKGRELVEAAGLSNVDLHVGDIVTYPRDGEKFDYIVCHGVLSWVPEPVRGSLIDLISARLAPGGIAYVSFDCLPGAAVKAAIVPFLRSRVSAIDDPAAAMRESAGVVGMIKRTLREGARLHENIDWLVDVMLHTTAGYFYHDWLAEHYAPIDLRQLIAAAAERNLRLAGSAANYDANLVDLDDEARQLIESYGDDWGARLIALDLMRGPHIFHRDLFVRSDAPPPGIIDGYKLLSYSFDGSREDVETKEGPATKYILSEQASIVTQHPGARAVLDMMIKTQPEEFGYGELVGRAIFDEVTLRNILFDICRSNFANARTTAPPFVLEPGERPVAGVLVRAMARLGTRVVSLRSADVEVKAPETRLLFTLCDGTRTRPEITAAMSRELGRDIPLAMVEGAVAHYAKRRLFTA